jgi:hypothetical protein
LGVPFANSSFSLEVSTEEEVDKESNVACNGLLKVGAYSGAGVGLGDMIASSGVELLSLQVELACPRPNVGSRAGNDSAITLGCGTDLSGS